MRPWTIAVLVGVVTVALVAVLVVWVRVAVVPCDADGGDGFGAATDVVAHPFGDPAHAQQVTAAPAAPVGQTRWCHELDEDAGEVLVDAGRAFVDDLGGTVSAFSLDDGTPLWSAEGQLLAVGASGVFVEELGWVARLDAATGATTWSFDRPDGSVGLYAALLGRDLLFTMSFFDPAAEVSPSRAYAVDASSGALRWEVDLEGESLGVAAASAGVALFALELPKRPPGQTRLVALEAASGNARWSRDGNPMRTALISDGLAVVLDRLPDSDPTKTPMNLRGLDLRSGREQWKLELERGCAFFALGVARGMVVASTRDESCGSVAVEVATGASRWRAGALGRMWVTERSVWGVVGEGDEVTVQALDPVSGAVNSRSTVTYPGPATDGVVVTGGVLLPAGRRIVAMS